MSKDNRKGFKEPPASFKIRDLLLEANLPDSPTPIDGEGPTSNDEEPKFEIALEEGRGLVAELWISKKDRGGKTVVLLRLRGQEMEPYRNFFLKIVKEIKKTQAVGASLKRDEVVIQTKDRERLKTLLESKGLTVIYCGG